jgi:hypothetical protein
MRIYRDARSPERQICNERSQGHKKRGTKRQKKASVLVFIGSCRHLWRKFVAIFKRHGVHGGGGKWRHCEERPVHWMVRFLQHFVLYILLQCQRRQHLVFKFRGCRIKVTHTVRYTAYSSVILFRWLWKCSATCVISRYWFRCWPICFLKISKSPFTAREAALLLTALHDSA